MYDVKTINSRLKLRSHLLSIKANTPLTQTIKKIREAKHLDFVLVAKPKVEQMAGVLATRLMGKKFIWVQNFQNPPIPNFLEKFLLTQADKIMVKNSKDAYKLRKFGISHTKIHLQSNKG